MKMYLTGEEISRARGYKVVLRLETGDTLLLSTHATMLAAAKVRHPITGPLAVMQHYRVHVLDLDGNDCSQEADKILYEHRS